MEACVSKWREDMSLRTRFTNSFVQVQTLFWH